MPRSFFSGGQGIRRFNRPGRRKRSVCREALVRLDREMRREALSGDGASVQRFCIGAHRPIVPDQRGDDDLWMAAALTGNSSKH